MRILVHEFVSGGGLAGQPVLSSLAREGAAIRQALVEDFAELRRHRIVTTVDSRFPLRCAPPGVDVVTLGEGDALADLLASVDAACLVAPETGGCLEALAARAEGSGTALLGPGAAAIRRAADKASLPELLARHGVPHPPTRTLGPEADGVPEAAELGYPLVVKPARGAGCSGVSLARRPRELPSAVEEARRAGGPLLLQRHVRGVAASVSLLCDGRRAVAVAVNAQRVRASRPFAYRGGSTPLEHPLADEAAEMARIACEALPGLKGYVGVDLVLTESRAVVIEVNPRFTTACIGVRESLGLNLAASLLAACSGRLPAAPRAWRRVRFTAAGRIFQEARVLRADRR